MAKGKDTIEKRFSPKIANGKYTTLPIYIFQYADELGITWDAAMFAAVVLSYKWTTDFPYPSIRKMSKKCAGISEWQLHHVKNELVGKGYLEVIPRFRKKDGKPTKSHTSSKYDFSGLIKAIDELISDKEEADEQPDNTKEDRSIFDD